MSAPGVELVMPAIAIGSVIASGGMTFAAVKRLERKDERRDDQIRDIEIGLATLKERVAAWEES